MEEVELGPWDCAMLVPLSGQQCCDMVRWSVPSLDVNGRHIECYYELPEEAEENKVILVWDPTTGTVSYIFLWFVFASVPCTNLYRLRFVFVF